jgi:hypothetical protein
VVFVTQSRGRKAHQQQATSPHRQRWSL